MNEITAGITQLMQGLALTDNRLRLLLEFKAALTALNISSLKNVIKAEHLLTLFSSFNSQNKEEIEVTCYLLSVLFPIVDPADVIHHLGSQLQHGLQHPHHEVKTVILEELVRVNSTTEGVCALIESPEVVAVVVGMVGSDDETIASKATRFLSSFGQSSLQAAASLLLNSPTAASTTHLEHLRKIMNKSDITRYRVYEIVCNIQSVSKDTLQLCINSGILDQLFNELEDNDVLLRCTCCTMLAQVAESAHSLNYLIQSGVVSEMTELVKNVNQDPFSSLYIPAVIRFFGNLSITNGVGFVLDIYSDFLTILFSMLDHGGDDTTTRVVAMETIGVIGERAEGKVLLFNEGNRCVNGLQRIIHCMSSGKPEHKLLAMDCFRRLMSVEEVDNEMTSHLEDITSQWCRLISPSGNPLTKIIAFCKQPFPDVKCAGYRILQSTAAFRWGLEAINNFPTFTEFILDRSTESDKNCKDEKYRVVQQLTKSPHCADVFGNRNYLRFRGFVKEGPHYVQPALSVAVEDA